MNSSQFAWRKSSHSADEGQCVEAGVWSTPAPATAPESRYALRDSKDPDGSILSLTSHEWASLLHTIKAL
ncbi:DUF397 domain-containing protein [Actinomadura adrarensis]|uniref:DUF397 domain-containing protein n=1 Tax=Actinomadura adrarensis TaxID=1819600 RepID=A0ABW3C915_9ACTN